MSISTIEKRFDLNSSLTGLISASYDISFCVLCLFISFYGERGHKPRWLALASFLIGLGSLVFSLPHFTTGSYKYGDRVEGKFIFPFFPKVSFKVKFISYNEVFKCETFMFI